VAEFKVGLDSAAAGREKEKEEGEGRRRVLAWPVRAAVALLDG
jgi:hypothetical protein